MEPPDPAPTEAEGSIDVHHDAPARPVGPLADDSAVPGEDPTSACTCRLSRRLSIPDRKEPRRRPPPPEIGPRPSQAYGSRRVACWLEPAAESSDTAMRWIIYFGGLVFELGIETKPELRLRPLLRPWDLKPENVTDETLRGFRDLKSQLAGESLEGQKATALAILHSRRRPRRPTTDPASLPGLSRIPSANGEAGVRGTPSSFGMKEWLIQIGHSAAAIDSLNVIHVAGTKGKGSTCAFAESFLRAYGERTGFPRKTGLYSSPHLIYEEERIRINTKSISRDLFAKYFFEVWDALSKGSTASGGDLHLPRYLQLWTLVSLHAFIREGVEAAIIETHHGGEYDATNVFERPVATVVTSLGMDHARQLGGTQGSIAWHKAGIFKHEAQAISACQDKEAAQVIRARAAEKDVAVQFIADDAALPTDAAQLKPDVQRVNCSLALAAARAVIAKKAPSELGPMLESDVLRGIERFSWPGRFQIQVEGLCQWFIDGAHNEMSVAKVAEWTAQSLVRVLIFNQTSEERDSSVVFERLAESLKDCAIQYVIFAEYNPHRDFNAEKDAQVESTPPVAPSKREQFADTWRRVQPDSRILFEPSIKGALDTARNVGRESGGVQTLITGSLHLVGDALFHLGQSPAGGGVVELC
ncbi:uncharacterized protein DNG_05751 [Cephalotrichum gorgonifer]|uniref:tetrahydrofolate synthase n=1 Tax=Cephalotrichum gorgonifer TaxID=2041049 RepID=A0AAE8N1D1_9PEZI|nr:uncharacterized protein DNG_05751 [Cephalotrichum gorgonifer]